MYSGDCWSRQMWHWDHRSVGHALYVLSVALRSLVFLSSSNVLCYLSCEVAHFEPCGLWFVPCRVSCICLGLH